MVVAVVAVSPAVAVGVAREAVAGVAEGLVAAEEAVAAVATTRSALSRTWTRILTPTCSRTRTLARSTWTWTWTTTSSSVAREPRAARQLQRQMQKQGRAPRQRMWRPWSRERMHAIGACSMQCGTHTAAAPALMEEAACELAAAPFAMPKILPGV